jgi:hypothetical protein
MGTIDRRCIGAVTDPGSSGQNLRSLLWHAPVTGTPLRVMTRAPCTRCSFLSNKLSGCTEGCEELELKKIIDDHARS